MYAYTCICVLVHVCVCMCMCVYVQMALTHVICTCIQHTALSLNAVSRCCVTLPLVSHSCSLQRDLGLAHLPLLITACIKCLASDKRQVTKMAAGVVQVHQVVSCIAECCNDSLFKKVLLRLLAPNHPCEGDYRYR